MSVLLLAARDVHQSCGRDSTRFDALRSVSIENYDGESLAVVGKSGSDKSTLLHLLALLDGPSDGIVELSGHDAAALSAPMLNQARNRTFGFVVQQFFSPRT